MLNRDDNMSNIGRKPGHKGYWKGKTWNKPSVFTDVNAWIGWGDLIEITDQPEKRRDRMILRFLFETGSRVSELIKYRKKNFVIENDVIRVVDAPLVKSDKFDNRWEFWIEKTEPLVSSMIEWLDEIDDWLFPSKLGKKPYLTRQYVWMVARREVDRYPHWFRSMRAFCMSWFHDLDLPRVRAWFTWTDPNTPQHYARPSPKKTAKKFRKYSEKGEI